MWKLQSCNINLYVMEKVMGQQMPENQLNQPEGDVGDEIAGDDE